MARARKLPDHVQRAIRSGPVPKLRDWRKLPGANLTRAERVMTFAERYLKVPNGKLVGSPLKLDVFQEAFIYSVFDNPAGTRRAFSSRARKNGKTAEIAVILLAFLCGPEAVQNAELASGALSRDQAATVFKYARLMAEASPQISPLIRVIPSSKVLIGLPMNVTYRALSADGKTNHGGNFLLAILDESGQVKGPHDDFIEAVLTSQGSHDNPLLIVISTQAASDADWLSIQLDHAEAAGDPKTVSHVYTADESLEFDDPKAWQQANPAMGLFFNKQELVDGAAKAKDMPTFANTFEWLHLNRRVSAHAPFVSQHVWKANGSKPLPLSQCVRVVGGLDLSAARDLTALVLIGLDEESHQHIHTYAWTPEQGLHDRSKTDRQPYDVWVRQGFLRTTASATVDYDFVAAEMMEILADVENLETIGFDRWRMDLFKRALERQGGSSLLEKLQPIGQGFKDQSICLDALEATLLNHRASHGMHPVLTMCAANAVVERDPAGSRKFAKHKATGRIDAMAALAGAAGTLGLYESQPEPDYGLIVL